MNNAIKAAALMLLSACATEVAGSAPAPCETVPEVVVTPTAPAAPAWYAHASERSPACRTQSQQGPSKPRAAFCVGMMVGAQGDCSHNDTTNETTCRGGISVQWEADGQGYAFNGEEFLAELTPGMDESAYAVRFDNGRAGSCSLSYYDTTLCVSGTPEKR